MRRQRTPEWSRKMTETQKLILLEMKPLPPRAETAPGR